MTVSTDLLRSLDPIRELTDAELDALADTSTVETISRGTCLLRRGTTDSFTWYLLKGELELQAADGKRWFLGAGSDKARAPIARLQPRVYDVTAVCDAVVLRIEDAELTGRIRRPDAAGLELIEFDEEPDAEGTALYQDLKADLEADCLVLPSLPEVAVRIRRMLDQDSSTAAEIGRVVQSDAAMAAKLVRAANSAFYAGQAPAQSCSKAIVRMGMQATAQLVMSFALREVFDVEAASLRQRMRLLWRHSAQVAAVAYVLARLTPAFDPEHALLAGLLHDVGAVAIIGYAARYRELHSDSRKLESVIRQLRAEVGVGVLEKWGFSEDLITVAREAELWHRDPAPEPDYCDVVLIAQLHAFAITPGMIAAPAMAELPALGKLAAGELTPALGLEVLSAARTQIAEAEALLNL